jgi:TfoX/Sxy family transcriptional regulator of competence genes
LTGANGFGYRRNMAWKKSPPELVQRFEKVAASLGTERRKMFGYPASFVHGNMFAGLHEDRFVLRLGRSTSPRQCAPVPGPSSPCPGDR